VHRIRIPQPGSPALKSDHLISLDLYFVGLVFGIGFDTTTEVVLLAATAYAAIQRNSIPTG
jgi:high-affinity nickel permease